MMQRAKTSWLTSGVLKERDESEIRVQLLVTMKQCVARIVGHNYLVAAMRDHSSICTLATSL